MSELMNPAVESVSAFFPCYNDEKAIVSMVEKIGTALEKTGADYEIIVVDDGSSDDSVKVLKALQADVPQLRVIEHVQNRGYGGALRSGMEAATKQWVFYTDGDAQYDPTEILELIGAARNGIDWVQGVKQGRGDPMHRVVIGRAYHHWVKFWFRLPVVDTDCDFRLMRKTLLDKVHLESSTGTICVEMMCRFRQAGATFVEVPVNHFARPHGKSQFFQLRRVSKSLLDLAKLWIRVMITERRSAK